MGHLHRIAAFQLAVPDALLLVECCDMAPGGISPFWANAVDAHSVNEVASRAIMSAFMLFLLESKNYPHGPYEDPANRWRLGSASMHIEIEIFKLRSMLINSVSGSARLHRLRNFSGCGYSRSSRT